MDLNNMTWTMKDVIQLQDYEGLGLKIRLDGEQIMASGRKTAEVIQWLRDRKQQVIELLKCRSEIPW